jgi:hypothetical protein
LNLKYLYNINAPSEWTSDISLTNYLSGDELNLVASYDGYHVNYNIPYVSYHSYMKAERNSIIVFDDLVLPCDGLKLHLFEKDITEGKSDISNTLRFNCSEIGFQSGIL